MVQKIFLILTKGEILMITHMVSIFTKIRLQTFFLKNDTYLFYCIVRNTLFIIIFYMYYLHILFECFFNIRIHENQVNETSVCLSISKSNVKKTDIKIGSKTVLVKLNWKIYLMASVEIDSDFYKKKTYGRLLTYPFDKPYGWLLTYPLDKLYASLQTRKYIVQHQLIY